MKKTKKYEELSTILNKMSRKDAYDAAEWVWDTYHNLPNPDTIVLTKEMKAIVDEIFKLAPFANCIPFTYETVDGNEYWTYVDLGHISYLEDYLAINEEEDEYLEELEWIMPYFSDKMTLGDWKKIHELWEKLLDMIGLIEGFEDDGDYCEYSHISTHIITKDYKIDELVDINR